MHCKGNIQFRNIGICPVKNNCHTTGKLSPIPLKIVDIYPTIGECPNIINVLQQVTPLCHTNGNCPLFPDMYLSHPTKQITVSLRIIIQCPSQVKIKSKKVNVRSYIAQSSYSRLIKTVYPLLPGKPVPWNTIATSAITAQTNIPTIVYRQILTTSSVNWSNVE